MAGDLGRRWRISDHRCEIAAATGIANDLFHLRLITISINGSVLQCNIVNIGHAPNPKSNQRWCDPHPRFDFNYRELLPHRNNIVLLLTYPVQKLTANVVPKLLDMVSKIIDYVLTDGLRKNLADCSFSVFLMGSFKSIPHRQYAIVPWPQWSRQHHPIPKQAGRYPRSNPLSEPADRQCDNPADRRSHRWSIGQWWPVEMIDFQCEFHRDCHGVQDWWWSGRSRLPLCHRDSSYM